MTQMKIKITRPTCIDGETVGIGVRTVDEKAARQLIGAGKAVPFVEDRKAEKAEKAEK